MRPVRLVFTREESIISTAKRHPSRTVLRMGLMRDGRIRALQMKMICDGGAYGLSTEGVMRKAAILAAGPYAIPNVRVDTYWHLHQQHAIRALSAPSVPCRPRLRPNLISISAPSGSDLDPFEIRRINAMRDGALTHTKAKLGSVSLMRALDALEKASGWEAGAPTSRGDTRDAISTATISGRHVRSVRALRRREKQEAAE